MAAKIQLLVKRKTGWVDTKSENMAPPSSPWDKTESKALLFRSGASSLDIRSSLFLISCTMKYVRIYQHTFFREGYSILHIVKESMSKNAEETLMAQT